MRLGVLVIAICGLVALAAGVQVLEWQRQLAALDAEGKLATDRLLEVRNAMDALLDIETGQRGFLLTGEEPYLEPYRKGLQDLELALSRLTLQFLNQPDSLAEVDSIVEAARARQSASSRTIELRRAGRTTEALELVRSGEGRRLMDVFREHAGRLQARLLQETADLRAREAWTFQYASMLGSTVTVLIVLLAATTIAWLSMSIRRLDELQRQREREAMHDSLTGLPNRRYLNEVLDSSIAAARRGGKPLAVAYFDLDGFKAVNDRFGHAAGDRVLQATAARLRAAVRASDFVARLGGDEFVAVLPGAPTPAELATLIGRLEREIAAAPIPELPDGAVSASIGVAFYPDDAGNVDALLTAADHAMYAAKERRRRARARGTAPSARAEERASV